MTVSYKRCTADTQRGFRCKRAAQFNHSTCDTHTGRFMFYIEIAHRSPYNGKYGRSDWRGYRKYSAWPILFKTRYDAEGYMAVCFTFKGIGTRKVSASIQRTKTRVMRNKLPRRILK